MNTPRWIVIAALVLALSLPVTPVNAAPSASVTITDPLPDPASIGSEVSFALIVSVTDIMPGLSGADIYVGYDSIVEPSVSPNNAVVPLPDFFGPSNITWYEIVNPCPVATGARTSPACIHLVAAGPAQVTHSGAVARFHFRIKAEGRACFSVLASSLANKDGFLINHDKPVEPECVNNGTTVIGTVFRQGTPANPNPGAGTLACTEVNGIFTNESGKFTLTNVPSGTHKVHAVYPGHLASATTISFPGGSTTVDTGPTELCGGDINADNKINILDIGRIIGEFGSVDLPVRSDTQEGCTDPDEAEDINDDGLVNIGDLAIAAGNWGRTAPTPWQPTGICDP